MLLYFVQIIIRENLGKYANLWRAALDLKIFPFLHIACFREVTNQVYQLRVFDFLHKNAE